MVDCEDKLRNDFLKALKNNSCGDVVDDLIAILKKDYVLLVKEPLYCHECIHYNNTSGWISPDYCVYYQRIIRNVNEANNCSHYFSGEEEARKSMARFHNSWTGDLFYK